jgi:malonate transporter and related proteins
VNAVATTVAPIFGLIALGFLAARFQWLSASAGNGIAEFTFLVAMPALLFRTIVVSNMGDAQPELLLGSYFASVGVVWIVATLASLLFLRRPQAEGAVFAMTASYGNIVLLGIPIALGAYGESAAPTAAIVVSVHVAVLWLAACIHLALTDTSRSGTPAQMAKSVLIEFGRNPIVVAIVVAALWRATGLGLHVTADRGIQLLAQSSVPCALFAVGFTLAGFRITGEARALAVSSILKNLALPALAWFFTFHVFGLPRLPATVITLFAAMPTGTATFLFASQNGIAMETTSASVALSTAVSMVTLPIVLVLLGQP